MATLSDPRNVVNTAEPPAKAPPILAVGPLAWVRNNLFSSWTDAALTVIATLTIVGILSSFFQWTIGGANWFAVTLNLRLLMLGRFPTDTQWRVLLLALLTAFTVGLGLAAWARISRLWAIIVVVVLALLFSVPLLVDAIMPLPYSYLAAGNAEIGSGPTAQTPQKQIGFIARAGETVRIRLATGFMADDKTLGGLYGFADNMANLLRGAAAERLTTGQRILDIEAQLQGDLLTQNQRDELTKERERLKVADPITDAFAMNTLTANVRLLKGAALEPLTEASLTPDSEPLIFQLPEDGWYVLEKTTTGADKGALILQTEGLYPALLRSFVADAETGGDGGQSGPGGRTTEFTRITDNFVTQAERPQIDGKNVPVLTIIDNQYRGERSPSDFLRAYLSPFLRLISLPLLILTLAVAAGYAAGRLADRFFASKEKPRRASTRAAAWLLIALPVLMFVFVYGLGSILPLTDTRLWGGLLLTFMLTIVGIIGSFPLGITLALGRRSSLPVISTFCTLYIEFVRGVPFIAVLFMSQLLVPLINPSLAETPGIFRAMVGTILFSAAYLAENVRGGLQSIPHGQEEAAKALGLNGFQIVYHITLPQALRAVIPALVGQCISLFKDTSLVAIVGLLDLTGISNNIVAQTEFLGRRREVLIFICVIYFVFSYAMATVARRIEESGAGAAMTRRI
jgi:His/Glu/Gln/Arg/opine family amino acid ABC transporter permease subunit